MHSLAGVHRPIFLKNAMTLFFSSIKALFLYEYCITFDEEVTNIWRTRGSRLLKVLWVFVSLLFMAPTPFHESLMLILQNRYTFFLSFTPTLLRK